MNTQPPALKRLLPHILQEGETLLWFGQSKNAGRASLQLGYVCAFILFGMYAGFAYWGYCCSGVESGVLRVLDFFLVCGLFSIICGHYQAAAEKQRVYAITNRRALIITPDPLGKPTLCTIPLSKQSICGVKRHADGTVDYKMFRETYGKVHDAISGFCRVADTDGAETAFRKAGAPLPPTNEARPAAFCRKMAMNTGSKWLLLICGFYLMLGVFLPVVIYSNGADLYLWGERTTATIVGAETRTEREGSRIKHWVTRYYPVLVYTDAATGPVRTTPNHGDKNPTWSYGQQVEILYTPGDTTRIFRNNADMHFNIGFGLSLIALPLLWLLFVTTKLLLFLKRSRQLPFHAESISPAE